MAKKVVFCQHSLTKPVFLCAQSVFHYAGQLLLYAPTFQLHFDGEIIFMGWVVFFLLSTQIAHFSAFIVVFWMKGNVCKELRDTETFRTPLMQMRKFVSVCFIQQKRSRVVKFTQRHLLRKMKCSNSKKFCGQKNILIQNQSIYFFTKSCAINVFISEANVNTLIKWFQRLYIEKLTENKFWSVLQKAWL